jgi:hypothetical protein
VVRLRYAYADTLEAAGATTTRWRGSTGPTPSTADEITDAAPGEAIERRQA